MTIYMMVCKFYWDGWTIQEIVELFGRDLLDYQHETHDKPLRFKYSFDVVRTIVECEKQAHEQVKRFN